MADAIFKGFAPFADGINRLLRQQFGVAGAITGDDFTVPARALDHMLSMDALQVHPQIKLKVGREREAADAMYAQIPEGLKRFQPPEPVRIPFSLGYGKLSELDQATNVLASVAETRVTTALRELVIPVLMTEFKSEFVTGVSLDDNRQQAWISFSKITMLAERYPLDEAQRRITAGALSGVLPFSVSILAFLDAITRLSPLMFTLPVHRAGCAWHFQCPAMLALRSAPANGVPFKFMAALSPLATAAHLRGMHGLRGMSEAMIWRYLKFCVAGLNRLMRFLHDPRSFTKADGSVDLVKKIQAYSAVHLLFADIAANNLSTTAHNRISYAMSALDKFANLRVQLGGHQRYGEDLAMAEMASESQAAELKRIIGSTMSAMNYDQPFDAISAVIDECYRAVHAHMGQQGSIAENSESARLARIRSQRNLRHGSFLKGEQFELLFFDSDGTVPDTIATLPLLLTLGFISDPPAFVRFRPTVAN